jgi:hypothetical protein
MIDKKDLIIAVLATFCLIISAYIVIAARNNGMLASGSVPTPTYDPILDVNHDGMVEGRDMVAVARAYMTSGDPTLNVTVSPVPGIPVTLPYWYIYSAPFIVCNESIAYHPSPDGVGNGVYETKILVHNPSGTSNVTIWKKLVYVAWWSESQCYKVYLPPVNVGPDNASEITSWEIYDYYSPPAGWPPLGGGFTLEGYACIISTSPYLDVNAYYTVSSYPNPTTGLTTTYSIDSQIISPKPYAVYTTSPPPMP